MRRALRTLVATTVTAGIAAGLAVAGPAAAQAATRPAAHATSRPAVVTVSAARSRQVAKPAAVHVAVGRPGGTIVPVTAPAPAPVSSTAGKPALGVPINPAELSAADLSHALDMAASAGVTSVSSGAVWWYLAQGGPRTYDFSALDRLVAGAKARGMAVTLQLSGTPDFVHPDLVRSVPDLMDRIWYAPQGPAGLAAWSAYVTDVVGHFGTSVQRYEMWNEPNLVDFWKSGPDPVAFAALVRAGYLAAKSVDAAAVVTTGGLSRNDIGFATATLTALASYPDATANGGLFDELGVHPYSDDRGPAVDDIRWVRTGAFGAIDDNFLGLRAMTALLPADKSVYVGEYGFSTTDTWMKAVPDEVRAQYLTQAVSLVRAMPKVSGLTWYHFLPTSTDDSSWTLLGKGFAPSQSFAALQAAGKSA